MDALAERIKEQASQLGFDAVGIAPVARLEVAERAIQDRVTRGLLRDYGFSRNHAAAMTHPEDVLPGAKSVIVVALSYVDCHARAPSRPLGSTDPDRPPHSPDVPRGRIARFARGRDYHKVVEERLRELGDWLIHESGGGAYRICVDTGPIIDRAVAREAGIGSYGKNALIVTQECGSWVVLGEVVTDVELRPDEPAPLEACGDCAICTNACPSGAIVEPYVIDQTKCISHLTQMKGSIPPELRPLIGDRIYGCDLCQEVCPRNLNARPGKGLPEVEGLDARPELVPLVNISHDEFGRIIGPTAIGWIGRASFRRNVIVALGNVGDSSVMPELTKALSDEDPIIREHALWAIEQIGRRDLR